MNHYAAFIRPARQPQSEPSCSILIDRFKQSHPSWQLLDWDQGLSLYHAPLSGRSTEILPMPNGRGVIIGTLFPTNLDTSPFNWRPVMGAALADDIIRTKGGRLIKEFWGGYIAFLNNRDGTEHYVVRDCSGKIPCYSLTVDGGTIVASNIEDLAGLGLPVFTINKRYLAGFISEAELAHEECALNEVTELLAGGRMELTATQTKQSALWDPRIIAREPAVDDFNDACHRVRTVTQSCVDFWASRYDRIVLMLSGGLDSSVVLGCLRNSAHSPRITCLHVESDGMGETESEFARLAATAANVELMFQPGYSQLGTYDERILDLPRAPKPSVSNLGVAVDPELRNLIPCKQRAEAVWDGQGGDHIFFEPRSAFGAVDYAYHHGFGGGLSQRIGDAVRRSNLSYWGVLAKTARLGVLRGRWQPRNHHPQKTFFLHPDAIASDLAEYVWQPWLADAAGIPPGKRLQIYYLGRLIHRHRPVPGLQYATEHHPLFSQPLLELCLRIPLYTLLRGGADRALERAAFSDCVPERIIRRENKGSISSSLMSRIRECLPFLRELVLDGILVQEGIVERVSLEPFLAGKPLSPEAVWPFLACIAAEAWARKWAESAWRL